MHGVLDLVGAGLGVTLVPASTALLGSNGVAWRPLRRRASPEMLELLRRKVDAHALLPLVEASVALILSR